MGKNNSLVTYTATTLYIADIQAQCLHHPYSLCLFCTSASPLLLSPHPPAHPPPACLSIPGKQLICSCNLESSVIVSLDGTFATGPDYHPMVWPDRDLTAYTYTCTTDACMMHRITQCMYAIRLNMQSLCLSRYQDSLSNGTGYRCSAGRNLVSPFIYFFVN